MKKDTLIFDLAYSPSFGAVAFPCNRVAGPAVLALAGRLALSPVGSRGTGGVAPVIKDRRHYKNMF